MQKKILIVEDEESLLKLESILLTTKGYLVQGATTGLAALEAIASETPDLILLDIMLPELDGFEVCKQIKKNPQTRHIPIIFLSAKKTPEDLSRGEAVGADAVNQDTSLVIGSIISIHHIHVICQQLRGYLTFGHHKSVSLKSTRLFYGMEPYSTEGLEKGLASIKVPGGISPLSKALDAARTDLGDISGKTALIIISDGKNMTTNVKASVQALKDVHGPSLCIYPILVGDDANGRALLESLAEIGGCGFISQAQSLLSTAGAIRRKSQDRYRSS